MNYFPKIETIDDVLPAVKGRDEFVVAERDWGIVIDYQIVLPDTFSSQLLRECRGIKFDLDGNLLARPYHKFFNLGEKESTQMDVLSKAGKFREDFVIMPKLDGCFASRTPVSFVDGTARTMKEIVEQKIDGPIWGMDEKTGELVHTKITDWHINGSSKNWLVVSVNDPHNGHKKRNLYVTPNHQIRTNNGYVRADKLVPGDIIYRLTDSLVDDVVLSVNAWDGRSHRKYDITTTTHNFVANNVVVHNSMIHPILWNDEVWVCTRMGITDVADQAFSFAWKDGRYMDFCYDLGQRKVTPIFEWCSRQQRIVLDYPQDELVLTAIRINETGEYLTRGKMRTLSDPYKIPMVGLYDGSWEGIEKFSEEVQDLENAEGYVIRWTDDMVKMKGDWYVRIHRAKDGLSHEKRVVAMILNDSLDDVLPHLLEDDYDRVIRYRDDFLEGLRDTTKELMHVVKESVHFTQTMSEQEARRYFATVVVQGQPKIRKKILFDIWGKVHPYAALIGFLRKKMSLDVDGVKNPGSQSVVDNIRPLFGNINWLDY